MKIKFWCDNGASIWCDNGDNIHSKRESVMEWDDEDWNSMTDSEKDEAVREWMWENLDYGWKELP